MRSQRALVRDSGASPDIAFNRSACSAILLSYFPFGLAGEEGFEPPHPVLETGGLPLNLLPFTLRAAVKAAEGQLFKSIERMLPSLHLSVSGMLSARVAEFLRLHAV